MAAVKPVVMESGKFLSTINNSAQSKVAQFESIVRKLGERSGTDWKLASLSNRTLVIEDVGSNTYYHAKHVRQKGGKISITDITPIKLVESKKGETFENNCLNLVESIENNDQRGMRSAYNNLASQKFSPRTIPEDGLVKTRDGIVRHLSISENKILTRDDKSKIIAALVECVADSVTLQDGQVVSAVIGEDRSKYLPISEWTCRKVVGNYMRDAATEAYKSPGFQARVYKVASLVNQDNIQEAVKETKAFLKESQEFALLTRAETKTLIENTLATKAVFNEQLCGDTTTLFYRTNLKVNRNDILREWRATAKKAGHPTLLENVEILASSKNFEGAYDKFLDLAFNEAISPRDEEINAYRAALDLLQQSPKLQEDQDLRTKVQELSSKLSGTSVDDATVHLVRETLAAARKEVDSLGKLDSFDEMPGDDLSGTPDELGDDLSGVVDDAGGMGGVPNIVINAPLISIGDPNAGAEDMGGLDDLGGEEDMDAGLDDLGGEEDELGGLGGEEDELGMGGEEDELGLGGEEDDDIDLNLDLSSIQKSGKSLSERASRKALGRRMKEDKDWFDKNIKNKDGDSDDSDSDSDDDSDDKDDDKDDDKGDFSFGEEWEKPWEKDEADAKRGGSGVRKGKKCNDCSCDPCECSTNESTDPYSYGKDVDFDSGLGSDYGQPVIESEMTHVVSTMFNIIEDRKIAPEVAIENLAKIASAAVNEHGIRIPKHKINTTIESVIESFCNRASNLEALTEDQRKWGTLMRRRGFRKSNLSRDEHQKGADLGSGQKSGGAGGAEGSAGYTGAAPGEASDGFGGEMPNNEKSGISGDHGSGQPDNEKDGFEGSDPGSVSESRSRQSIVWLEHDQSANGMLGDLNGVRFLLDYASPAVILSEDGQVEVPIPESVIPNALASAKLKQGNPQPFVNWLSKSIEQFRPITEHEDLDLAEAVATITAHGDGTIEVNVDGDTQVGELGAEAPMGAPGDEMGGMDDMGAPEMGGMDDMGGDPAIDGMAGDMQPVSDVGPDDGMPPMDGGEEGGDLPGEEMPDFEGGDMSPEPPAEGPEVPPQQPESTDEVEDENVIPGEEEEQEPPMAEDKDITDPTKGKYDTTGEDHRDMSKQGGKLQKPSDGNKIDEFDKELKDDGSADADTKLTKVKPGPNRP